MRTQREILGAHRFGSEASTGRFSIAVQAAARSLSDGNSGIADLTTTVAWTRRMVELDDNLALTAAAGMGAVAWGFDHEDTGIAHLSTPITVGVGYDIHIGTATFSPFVAPSVAYYDNRTYANDVRTAQDTGGDARTPASPGVAGLGTIPLARAGPLPPLGPATDKDRLGVPCFDPYLARAGGQDGGRRPPPFGPGRT